jgi:hypothetical protein
LKSGPRRLASGGVAFLPLKGNESLGSPDPKRMTMKIYIASSWKNETLCRDYARTLREWGHDVDVFCELREGRTIFSFDEISEADSHNAISMLQEPIAQKWIDWADCVLMLLPCGNSAHLEAGYAKGCGKKLYIVGDFKNGEFDVMYGFSDGLFKFDQPEYLKEVLEKGFVETW